METKPVKNNFYKNNGVTIAVCTYNRKDLLHFCLKSILNQIKNKNNFELLIIDDHSTGNTKKYITKLSKKYKNIRYFFYDKNVPVSTLRNKAIALSKYNFLLYLDDDVILSKNYIKSLLQIIKKTNKIAIFGGPIVPMISKNVNKNNVPTWFTNNIKRGCAYAYLYWKEEVKDLVFPESLHTANCILNLRLLGSNAYFDKQFGESDKRKIVGEDVELCWRAIKNNLLVKYFKRLEVLHQIPSSKISKKYIFKKNIIWGKTEAKLHHMFIQNRIILMNNIKDKLINILFTTKILVFNFLQAKSNYYLLSKSLYNLSYIFTSIKIFLSRY